MTRFEYALEKIPDLKELNEYDFFELGTGGSLFHPLLAFAIGFRSVHTCDRVDIRDPRLITMSLDFILLNQGIIEERLSRSAGMPIHLDTERLQTLDSIRFHDHSNYFPISFHETYTTESSVAFFKHIKCSFKAFVFSSDVLEHVNPLFLERFNLFLTEPRSKRLIMYHFINLSDHFATGSISKYRFRNFPEWLWKLIGENEYHYCNRLSENDFLALFDLHGIFATRSDHQLAILEIWCDSALLNK